MLAVLRAAVSGMLSSKVRVDIAGTNLANINTAGYKQSRVELKDLPYEDMPNSQVGTGVELRLGAGAELMATQRMFLQGAINPSSVPTDMAIYGDGFFSVQALNGEVAYTRNGSFRVDEAGQLVTATGQRLIPPVFLPPNATDLRVEQDGSIVATVPDEEGPQTLGQLQLSRFDNPAGLIATGDGLFRATDVSGPANVGAPGDIGFGQVYSGSLELATVDLAEEMTQMMMGQRAYELNSRAFATLDQMIGKLTEFRR